MTKIPMVLIPRFPSHNEFLCHFKTMVEFHKAYPLGKSVDGKDLPAEAVVELPIFGAESLDKLVNEILGPTMLGKRLTSFVNQNDPLTVPFVRDALSMIEQIYRLELAAMSLKVTSTSSGSGNSVATVTEMLDISKQEGDALEEKYKASVENAWEVMAAEHVNKSVLILKWSPNLLKDVTAQPMVQDGAAKVWFFSSGLDATKDPPRSYSMYRFKAGIDEEHLKAAIDISSRSMSAADTLFVMGGRNTLVHKEVRKILNALRPKVGIKDLTLEPDEAAIAKVLHLESNGYGSVDVTEQYFQVVKDANVWKQRKCEDRRFVPGNTAFRRMTPIPILTKTEMTTVTFLEREAAFRNVVATDRFTHASRGATKGVTGPVTTEKDEDGDDPMDDDDGGDMELSAAASPEIVDPASKVVFFLMEYHQRVHTVGSSTGALLVVVKPPWVPPRMGGTRPMKARF